jgi:cell division septation protein DedD
MPFLYHIFDLSFTFAVMIELARHIEILLLENDCVMVPGFGGFITYYTPASWNVEENIFSPPVRTIGFNPRLKMNDGILVQSYMEAYHTNFADATKILEQAVNKLVGVLHKEGKVDMSNIGEISLSVHGTYVFSPYDDKIISPFLYGLDSFEIKEFSVLQQPSVQRVLNPQMPVIAHKKTYEIRINRALLRNAVAAVAAIVLFFYMSTPIQNTYVEKENYAQLLPADLFSKIGQQSLLTTPIEMDGDAGLVVSQPEVTVEPEAEPQPASKLYHIIIASVVFNDDAQALADDLKAEGYQDACVLAGDDRIRVSIGTYSTREEANRRLVELRRNGPYKNAWLLIR